MTSWERILNTIKGQAVDRVPIYAPSITARAINPLGVPLSLGVARLLMDGIPHTDPWMIVTTLRKSSLAPTSFKDPTLTIFSAIKRE